RAVAAGVNPSAVASKAPARWNDIRALRAGHHLSPQVLLAQGAEPSFRALRCPSNQSAMVDMSFHRSGQPWAAPFLTTSLVSTPADFSLSMINSACWIGTR